MALALTALETLDVQGYMSTLSSLQSQGFTYAKLGKPGLPGIPDLGVVVGDIVKMQAKIIMDELRPMVIKLALLIITAAAAKELAKLIPEINKVIAIFNRIIRAIRDAMAIIIPITIGVFAVIIVLVILQVISGVIAAIPSVTVGLGVGMAFDAIKFICGKINTACVAINASLIPIAFKVIPVLMKLLKIFAFLNILLGIMGAFNLGYNESALEAGLASSATAASFAKENSSGDKTDNISKSGGMGNDSDDVMVECTLPSGEVVMLSAADCLAAGGSFGEETLLSELNDIDNNINNLNKSFGPPPIIDPNLCWDQCQHGLSGDGFQLITCGLPDGTTRDMTLSECNALNGQDYSLMNLLGVLNKLKSDRDNICKQLGPLCNLQLGGNILTSLIHSNDDVVIRKVKNVKGKRYGFYGAEGGTDNYNVENIEKNPTFEITKNDIEHNFSNQDTGSIMYSNMERDNSDLVSGSFNIDPKQVLKDFHDK